MLYMYNITLLVQYNELASPTRFVKPMKGNRLIDWTRILNANLHITRWVSWWLWHKISRWNCVIRRRITIATLVPGARWWLCKQNFDKARRKRPHQQHDRSNHTSHCRFKFTNYEARKWLISNSIIQVDLICHYFATCDTSIQLICKLDSFGSINVESDDRRVDWLVIKYWLLDWLTDWLVPNCYVVWVIDWLTIRCFNWLTDWLFCSFHVISLYLLSMTAIDQVEVLDIIVKPAYICWLIDE